MPSDPCPCHSGKEFERCCKPFIHCHALPEKAVQLMRARYSAYSLLNGEYLKASWHASKRPPRIELNDKIQWIRLTIENVTAGTAVDDKGEVEYIAVFKLNGKAHRLHEHSRFVKDNRQWFYLDGDILTN